jgi:hypothetical protein
MVTDVKKLPIQFDRDRVVAFCRDRGIVRLSDCLAARDEACDAGARV